MKVQLYIPPGGYFAERWSGGRLMPDLGQLYIAAVLEREGIQVEVVPSHVLGMDWRAIRAKIARDRPDVIGATATTENRFQTFRLARVAKRAHPGAFVVLGGPHFNGTARDTLEHLGFVDGVVEGEGETTVLDLVRALAARKSLVGIPGLSVRHDGKVLVGPPRARLEDLNELPRPARHLIPWERYNFRMDVPGHGALPAGNLMTSRGCPFSCTFCATPGNWGRKVRALTPENVLGEIEELRGRYGAQAIVFFDDTFNFNPERSERICDLMLEQALDLHWWCEVRVDILTRELLVKMARSGCYSVGFGIESASERICREIITKRATLEEAMQVIRWSNELGVTASPFFIFSHPTETWEEAQETIRVIERVRGKADPSVAILHVYPGTNLERRAREEGKMPADFSWTRRRDPRVILLPAAQGHVPLYVDKLTWAEVCELMFRFSLAHKKVRLWRKVPVVLRSIYSWRDVVRYAVMLAVFLRVKLGRWAARAGARARG